MYSINRSMHSKERFIEKLDEFMKINLKHENELCGGGFGISGGDPNYIMFSMNHFAMETMILFANEFIGRKEVNKLCKKYKINNVN